MLSADMQASCSYSLTVPDTCHRPGNFSPTHFRNQRQMLARSCELSGRRQRRERAKRLLCKADSEMNPEAARWLRQLESGQKIGSEYGEVGLMSIRAEITFSALFPRF